jgi:FlaA1/EpsC-like NDP-sugar epimerase
MNDGPAFELGQHTSRFGRPRTTKQRRLAQWFWFAADLAFVVIAALATAWLIERHLGSLQWGVVGLMALVQVLVFWRRGFYQSVLRYSGIVELITVAAGVMAGIGVAVVLAYFLDLANTGGLGRVFLVVHGFAVTALSGGARLVGRRLLERKTETDRKRVLIYGSGSLGEMVLRELRSHPSYDPVGLLDDDHARHGARIHGLSVLGGFTALQTMVPKPDLLVIAQRALPQQRLRQIFQDCMELAIQVKVTPGIISQKGANHIQIQDIALEDLLRRPARSLDQGRVRQMLKGKTVLVTGAGGSIGSELCRQIALAEARHLILLDHSEFNLYQIDNGLRVSFPHIQITPVLATLADRGNLETIVSNHRPQIVFHAAAYKHVPMVEANPFLGMLNNLGGFANLLEVCNRNRVEQLVTISTDKAVRPTNIMGASKRACEVLMQNLEAPHTRLCAVRFGNVLGSSGSVIPHFLEQIRRGGPVTVTHPEVTRFFMLLPEAVELVLQAGAVASHGQILILDMGDPVKIVNLARQLIFMTGNIPDRDIAITYTGLRPGEKLYEELLLQDSEAATVVDGITVASPTKRDHREVATLVNDLLSACHSRDLARFLHVTGLLVPEWEPSQEFKAIIDGRTDSFPVLKG